MEKEKAADKPKQKPRAVKSAGKTEELFPVEDLAETASLKSWETAGLMTAKRWAPGKQVSKADFQMALTAFRSRHQGGGRI